MTEIYRLAKVTPPKVNDVVPRRRLLDLLESYRQKQTQLILLIAEAGFGKTSLAADFISRLDAKVAWCDLEDSDRNFAQFLTFLVYSIQQTLPIYNLEQTEYDFAFLKLFRQTQANLGREAVAPALVYKLADALASDLILFKDTQLLPVAQDLWLILDNYQFGQSNTNNYFLEQLLNWQLPYFRVLLLARKLPEDFPFAALSLDKRAEFIGPPQLRFEKADTTAFMEARYGPDLDPIIIEKIHTITQGWAVALRLTLVSLEQSGALNQPGANLNQIFSSWLTSLEKATNSYTDLYTDLLVDAESPTPLPEVNLEPFLNYLTTTFLAHQPADRQLFLLQTSLLETISLQNCQRLTGHSLEECQSQLVILENQSLLLTRLDSKLELFKYHSLIRGFLQLLFKKKDPLNYRASCATVALLYQEAAQYQLAIENWLQAGEIEQAVQLACQIVFKFFETSGYYSALKKLLASLPPAVLEKKARLLHVRGLLAQEAGNLEKAEELFEQAIDLYESEAEVGLWLKAKTDLAFSLAVTDRYELAISLAETVLEQCQPYISENLTKLNKKDTNLEWFIRAAAHAHLALGSAEQRMRQYNQAEKNYLAAEKFFFFLGDRERVTVCQGMLATTYRVQGNLLDAGFTFQRILNHWERSGNYTRMIYIRHYLASIKRHSGAYSEALAQFERNITRMKELQQNYLLPYIWYEMAECYTALGEYSQAEAFYQKSRQEVAGGKLAAQEVDTLLGLALNRWLSLKESNSVVQQQTLDLLQEAQFLIKQNKLSQKQPHFWLAFSLTQIDQARYQEATKKLELGLSLLEQYPDAVLQARLVFMLAVVAFRLDDQNLALEKLAHSLELSSSFSYYPYLPYELARAQQFLGYAASWLKTATMPGATNWQNLLSNLLPKFLEQLTFTVTDYPAAAQSTSAASPASVHQTAKPATASPTAVALELKGLDGGKVFKNGVEITQWAWPKARGLLFYMMERTTATAEKIQEDFWPKATANESKGSVYSLVSDLRKTFDYKDIIFKKNGSYWLKTDIIAYDVTQFERAAKKLVTLGDKAATADLQATLELHCQEYLENFSGLWVEERRGYLKNLYIELLNLLGQRLVKEAKYFDAVAIWRKLLVKDPYYDEAHLSLIETYKKLGQEAAARQQQQKYDETLENFSL